MRGYAGELLNKLLWNDPNAAPMRHPLTVGSNVDTAVNLYAKHSAWPEWLWYNGSNHIEGALDIELANVSTPEGDIVPAGHYNITSSPTTRDYMSFYINDSLYGNRNYIAMD
jgi:hypothetical protein